MAHLVCSLSATTNRCKPLDGISVCHQTKAWLICLQNEDVLANMIRRRGSQPTSNTSLWACLGRLINYKDGKPVHQGALAMNAGLFFIAGYQTTSNATIWALLELACNKSLQVKDEALRSKHAASKLQHANVIHFVIHVFPVMFSSQITYTHTHVRSFIHLSSYTL